MGQYTSVIPANGRDYTSAKAARADFDANKDFILMDFSSPYDGKPASKDDLKGAGYTSVQIRYQKKTKVTVVEL
jgi:hypothetical protein